MKAGGESVWLGSYIAVFEFAEDDIYRKWGVKKHHEVAEEPFEGDTALERCYYSYYNIVIFIT